MNTTIAILPCQYYCNYNQLLMNARINIAIVAIVHHLMIYDVCHAQICMCKQS